MMKTIILTAAAAFALVAGSAYADLGDSLAKARQHYGQPVKIEQRDLADYVTEYYVPVNKDENAFGLTIVQTYYRESAVEAEKKAKAAAGPTKEELESAAHDA
jgi:hypothetical protein